MLECFLVQSVEWAKDMWPAGLPSLLLDALDTLTKATLDVAAVALAPRSAVDALEPPLQG